MNAGIMKYWYAIQCASGKESVARKKIENLFSGYKTFFPRRELEIRKSGKTSLQVTPLFKGYFFISSKSGMLYREAAELVKKINDNSATAILYNVVGMNAAESSIGSDTLVPVKKNEMDKLFELTQGEEVVPFSSYLKEGSILKIISGPLKGLEALLVKVNSRKRRIRVAVELFGKKQYVDLGASMVS
ncbi:MAG: transcription termination/antitermination NusG family protein [Leptospirales bacterium]